MDSMVCSARSMAALSAGESDPAEVAATKVASLVDLDRKGAFSVAAFTLAVLAGRNCELLFISTLDSEGRDTVSTTVTTIQPATISQRKRTVKRPRAANKRWSSRRPRPAHHSTRNDEGGLLVCNGRANIGTHRPPAG